MLNAEIVGYFFWSAAILLNEGLMLSNVGDLIVSAIFVLSTVEIIGLEAYTPYLNQRLEYIKDYVSVFCMAGN